jgi:hypothetical protein
MACNVICYETAGAVMQSKSVNRCGSLYTNDSHANPLLRLLGLTELLVRNREVNLSPVAEEE